MVPSNSFPVRSWLPALFLGAALPVLLLAGCDSMGGLNDPTSSHLGPVAGSSGDTGGAELAPYEAMLLPEAVHQSMEEIRVVIDADGGVFTSTDAKRAARWTVDASGNVSGPLLLGTLPEPWQEADQRVWGTNAQGDVVFGYTQIDRPGPTAGWVWANGAMTLLPASEDAYRVYPAAVNGAGVLVGQIGMAEDELSGDRGAVWLPPYDAQPILLPDLAGYSLNSARGITDEGVITGWVRSSGMPDALVQWEIDAEGNVLRGPDLQEESEDLLLADVNQDLDAVGYFAPLGTAALYRSDSNLLIILGRLEGHSSSWARGVSNRNYDGTVQVVGNSLPTGTLNQSRPALWSVDATGSPTDPIELVMPNGYPSDSDRFNAAIAHSVNGQNRIVGYSRRGDGSWFATLWTLTADGLPPEPPPQPEITLEASGLKVQGRQTIDLTWQGSNDTRVRIYRDGSLIATPSNTGSFRDQTSERGNDGTYVHQVCEFNYDNCSAEVTTIFGDGDGDGGGDDPPPPGDGPTASFDYSCGNSPTCQFTDTSTEGGVTIVSRDWATGNQTASGSSVSFTFGTAGDHVVTLTVTDAEDVADQTSTTVKCTTHRVHGLRCS